VVCRQFIINFVINILVCLSAPIRYVVLKYFGCAALHLCNFLGLNIVYSYCTLLNVLYSIGCRGYTILLNVIHFGCWR
jgi:hypothetical protein